MDECQEKINHQIAAAAKKTIPVLILGETGTGKERVASGIHEQSGRDPYLVLNCGSIQESLIESELFGHVKGSFTGATANRHGLFESASGGTLFLDEIGELPMHLQPRLLRVIETGEVRRVGDSMSRRVDVRIISATHRDLAHMVSVGQFREDLYYRLNVFPIHVSPLRDRPDHFTELLEELGNEIWGSGFRVDQQVMDLFLDYRWPGNVRELINVLEYGSATGSTDIPLSVHHLPPGFGTTARNGLPRLGPTTMKDLAKHCILESLSRNQWNKVAAAAEMGISLKTLYNHIHEYGLAESLIRERRHE